jgi:hypothetical protein
MACYYTHQKEILIMAYTKWMNWEGGVDLVGATQAGLAMPNLIVHVARLVHTPIGSAPSGLIFWQPDPSAAPLVMGYVCTDPTIGAYYGPNIFAGTPFEQAPVLKANIQVEMSGGVATTRVEVPGFVFETSMSNLGEAEIIHRAFGEPMPFVQQGLEARAGSVTVKINGVPIEITVPDVGISGGYGAVFSACGLYAR